MDAINTNLLNNIELSERTTCGKIKSKAKTILVCQIDKNHTLNKDKENTLIIPTIEIDKFIINYNNLNDYETIYSHLIHSTIIISNSPNPKESHSHILVLPGYLCEIKINNISHNIDVKINFKNFFPHNIPININNLHFMIWFNNIIPNKLIDKINLSYKLTDIEINKCNTINNNFLLIQQTQTFNVICKNKIADIIIKNTLFNNICRVFWIKFDLIDYNNLDEFTIKLNGQIRLILTKKQIELICDKKIISNKYALIFINLEFCSSDWSLPQDLKEIRKIFSNSLNTSRIDNIKWYFKFANKFTNNNIQITSLSGNILSLDNNIMDWKLFYN